MTDWHNFIETQLSEWIRRPRLGIISDVDGTLSHIAERPEAATVTERSRTLLKALLPHVTLLAAVSGRAAADIQQRVGVAGMVYIGNHGLERWQDGQVVSSPEVQAFRPALVAMRDALQPETDAFPGAFVEDKIATLSVHYRRVENADDFLKRLRPVIKTLCAAHDLRLHEGRSVLEIRPPVQLNKGTAFRALVAEYELEAAIYLGDDVTDLDAIRAAQDLRARGQCYAFGLAVDSPETPASVREGADFSAEGVEGVEDFLDWALMSRRASVI